MTHKHKPLIGILLDWQENGSFSKRPHYALRQLYFDAISLCGGLPIGLAYDRDHMDDYITNIDGLLCPGGNYASPREWYISPEQQSTYEASPRAEYEVDLIKKTVNAGKPVLGICGGMQVLGAAYGCKMVPDLHDYYDTSIDHKNGTSADGFAFNINIEPQSQLCAITNHTHMKVNTAHREAIVKWPEDKVLVSAFAEDGVVQAIEILDAEFALGVQWHPEFFVQNEHGQPGHRKIFEAFIHHSGK